MKLADTLGRLWDFSHMLLLLLLFLMNTHNLEANLVGVRQYEWQTLTQPRTFIKERPPIRDYICVSSQCHEQWKGNGTEKEVLTCHQTPDTFYHLCSRKKNPYFYKMPCVLKVHFISVPISRKILLFIRILLVLLLLKDGHRDFHLSQTASPHVLSCIHLIPMLLASLSYFFVLCSPWLCSLSFSCMPSVNTHQKSLVVRPNNIKMQFLDDV